MTYRITTGLWDTAQIAEAVRVFVFSKPGFEDFTRAASLLEGKKNTPLPKAEDDEIQRTHAQ